jgi:hypothetical protein
MHTTTRPHWETQRGAMLLPNIDFRDLGHALHKMCPNPRNAKSEIEDDRTPEQRVSHRFGVFATDPGMSGWGRAANGVSACVWACPPTIDINKVLAWVERRSDMEEETIVDLDVWVPDFRIVHTHIYVFNPCVLTC